MDNMIRCRRRHPRKEGEMTRLSWHLESLAWWLLLTGMLAVYCVVVTVGTLAALFRAKEMK